MICFLKEWTSLPPIQTLVELNPTIESRRIRAEFNWKVKIQFSKLIYYRENGSSRRFISFRGENFTFLNAFQNQITLKVYNRVSIRLINRSRSERLKVNFRMKALDFLGFFLKKKNRTNHVFANKFILLPTLPLIYIL